MEPQKSFDLSSSCLFLFSHREMKSFHGTLAHEIAEYHFSIHTKIHENDHDNMFYFHIITWLLALYNLKLQQNQKRDDDLTWFSLV